MLYIFSLYFFPNSSFISRGGHSADDRTRSHRNHLQSCPDELHQCQVSSPVVSYVITIYFLNRMHWRIFLYLLCIHDLYIYIYIYILKRLFDIIYIYIEEIIWHIYDYEIIWHIYMSVYSYIFVCIYIYKS